MNNEKTTSPFDLSGLNNLDEIKNGNGIDSIVGNLPHGRNLPANTDEVARTDKIARDFGMLKDGMTTLPSKRNSSNLPRKHLHMMLDLPVAEWFINWTKENRYTYELGIKILIDFYRQNNGKSHSE